MTKTQIFILGLIGLIQSFIMVITMGVFWPSFQSDYIGYCLDKNLDLKLTKDI